MEKSEDGGRGTIVLATVRGDVHDIGKNLVDIILSNNGYDVVNIGIKQPISAIIAAAEEHKADVIGMSGLLVKSTVVMRDNLAELNDRGLAERWPVLLGGAALTRAYVEQDLAELFGGEVRYARDAFEGLRLMDAAMAVKRGVPGAALPALRQRRVKRGRRRSCRRRPPTATQRGPDRQVRSAAVAVDNQVPEPPFWGTRIVKGIPLADYAAYLDERATFMGQWGLKPSAARRAARATRTSSSPRGGRGCGCGWSAPRPKDCCRPPWCTATSAASARATTSSSCRKTGEERERFTFPRQQRDERLCLADYFRPPVLGGDGRGGVPARHHGRGSVGGHRRAVRR